MSIATDLAAYVSLWDVTGDLQEYASAIGSMFAEVESFAADIDDGALTWTPNGYSEQVMTNGPVAYWRLGDASGTTAADTMANAHPGTYTGTVTLGQAGALSEAGKAALFDGSTGYVSIPYAAALTTAKLTAEAWIYPTATSQGCIFNAAGSNKGFSLTYNAGVLTAVLGNGTTTTTFSTASLIAENAWNHVAVTYDGTNVVLYVNGVTALSTPYSGYQAATSGALTIGTDVTHFFQGDMQEVALYTFALTSAQVLADYQAQKLLGGMIPGTAGQQVGWGPLWDYTKAPAKALPWIAMLAGEGVPQGYTTAQTVALIQAAPNQHRGTPQAIANAVKQVLTGAQTVGLRERYNGSTTQNDSLSVVTFLSQTPNQNAVLAALRRSVPADIAIYYQALAGETWSTLEGSSTWATIETGSPSWSSLQNSSVINGYTVY